MLLDYPTEIKSAHGSPPSCRSQELIEAIHDRVMTSACHALVKDRLGGFHLVLQTQTKPDLYQGFHISWP